MKYASNQAKCLEHAVCIDIIYVVRYYIILGRTDPFGDNEKSPNRLVLKRYKRTRLYNALSIGSRSEGCIELVGGSSEIQNSAAPWLITSNCGRGHRLIRCSPPVWTTESMGAIQNVAIAMQWLVSLVLTICILSVLEFGEDLACVSPTF